MSREPSTALHPGRSVAPVLRSVAGGPGAASVYPLVPGRNLVGRGPGCHVRLAPQGVSRRHATLTVEAGRTVIADLGSTNGTFVNGHRVRQCQVRPGDAIAFGPWVMELADVPREEVDLAVAPAPGGEPWDVDDTVVVPLAGARQPARWLRIVEDLLRGVTRGGGQPLPEALLARLGTALPVAGACLWRPRSSGEPILLEVHGAIDPGVLPRGAGSADGGAFTSSEEVTAVCTASADALLGLAVFGEFPCRTESEPLLRATLALLESFLQEQGTAVTPSAEPSPGEGGSLEAKVRRLAAAEIPVLLEGEAGVGKGVVARALHRAWAPQGELLEVDGRKAAPEELAAVLDSSGSGARTLFLRQANALSDEWQQRIADRLSVAGSGPVPFLVVAVDHGPELAGELEPALMEILFPFRVPPLRERREEIPSLAGEALRRSCRQLGRPFPGITVDALQALVAHPWPGNLRELERVMRDAALGCPKGQPVRRAQLPAAVREAGRSGDGAIRETDAPSPVPAGDEEREGSYPLPLLDLETLEERAIEEALRRTLGNQVQAAELLGISRHALRRRMIRHELLPRPAGRQSSAKKH